MFCISIRTEIIFSSSVNNTTGNLTGIALNYRLLWVVYPFSLYWFFQTMNMVYFSIYLCPLWLPRKVHLVKAMVFPVVMYGCESCTVKKAEHRRIDAFELWCWRRHLRVPWTARRSNQSILKEISPEYSLEGLMLKLILWPPDAKNWLRVKDPDAGQDWRQEEKVITEDEMAGWHHWLDGHEFE